MFFVSHCTFQLVAAADLQGLMVVLVTTNRNCALYKGRIIHLYCYTISTFIIVTLYDFYLYCYYIT